MKFNIFFTLFFLLSFSQNNELKLVILNNCIKDNDSIILEIYNNSKNHYYIPIDYIFEGENPILNIEENNKMYPKINIHSNNIKLHEFIEVNTHDGDLYEKFDSISEKLSTFENVILIKSKSTYKLKLNFKLIKKRKYHDGKTGWNIENFNNLKLDVTLDLDCELYNTLYEEEFLKSLNEKGIKCYNGVIRSNKVPIKNSE